MKEGDIILTPLPHADGTVKDRPALLLRKLPPYGDYLVCGISSQLQRAVPDFDEVIAPGSPDFVASSLTRASVIRLGFLAVLPSRAILGTIGSVGRVRHHRLLLKLSQYLIADT